MEFFNKFTNPVWREASKLPNHQKIFVATLITTYGYFREEVKENLVKAFLFNPKLSVDKRLIAEENLPSQTKIIEILVDETIIGVLRSCKHPTEDLSGKLSEHFASVLPEYLGIIALSDANSRSKKAKPLNLGKTDYSSESNKARDQVLLKWKDLLGITDANFQENAKKLGFSEAWSKFTQAFFTGLLAGLGRTGNDEIIERARVNSSNLSGHLIPIFKHIINTFQQDIWTDGFEAEKAAAINVTRAPQLITVFIVDNNDINRWNLRHLLRDVEDIKVVGESATGMEAIEKVDDLNPDVLLIDIKMLFLDGISVTAEITRRHPDANVIICTNENKAALMREAVIAGAKDYFSYPIIASQLIEAIRRITDPELLLKERLQAIDTTPALWLVGLQIVEQIKQDKGFTSKFPDNSWEMNHSEKNMILEFGVLLNRKLLYDLSDPYLWIVEIAFRTGLLVLQNDDFELSEVQLVFRVNIEGDDMLGAEWIASCKVKDLIEIVSSIESDKGVGAQSRIINIMEISEI
jgi:CheY-like chemotaxis protein